jgi:uncharacterized protein (TIGR02246 family)
MKRILGIAALLVALTCIAIGQDKPKGEKDKPKGEKVAAASSTEQAVRQLFDGLVSSYAKNDATVPARILADDFTFTTPFGEVMTKEQRLAEIKPGGIQFDSYTADDVNVRVYGDTAVVTNKASVTGKRGDQDLSGQYRVTSVFVKKGGNWQLVAAQSTRITEMPTK